MPARTYIQRIGRSSSEWCAQKSIDWRMLTARRSLSKKNKKPSILIDTDVIRWGVTHTNCWVNTGEAQWGNSVPVETGYRARIPKESIKNRENEVNYLVGVSYLASMGLLDLCTSDQLQKEISRHPAKAKSGNSMGVSLFSNTHFRLLQTPSPYRSTSNFHDIFPSKDQQIKQLNAVEDPEWQKIRNTIDKAHMLDAFHLWTAHLHNIDFFLTMDKKFLNHMKTLQRQGKFNWLKVSLATPEALAETLGIPPVDYRLIGLIDRPFLNFVIFDSP